MNQVADQFHPAKERKPSWAFVWGGFACLLGGAFYDNIRGPLLPPMAGALGMEFTEVGSFLAAGYASATITNLCLMAALNKWPERLVTICLAMIGVGAGLVSQWVHSRATMYLLAILVGCTVSTLGAISNVLVVKGAPEGREGRLLSALHGMYGFGSALATVTVGDFMSRGLAWSSPYFAAVPFFVGLGIYAAILLREDGQQTAVIRQSGKLNGLQYFVVFMFSIYVAGEVATATWMTSYLVRTVNLSVSEATPYVSVYFLIMTVSRLACAVFLKKDFEKVLLRIGLVIPVVFFMLGYRGFLWAFPLMGFYGPFFPVFLARISRVFSESSRNLTILALVGMNAMVGLCSIGLGRVADAIGMRYAYVLAPVLLIVAFILLHVYFWFERKKIAKVM